MEIVNTKHRKYTQSAIVIHKNHTLIEVMENKARNTQKKIDKLYKIILNTQKRWFDITVVEGYYEDKSLRRRD